MTTETLHNKTSRYLLRRSLPAETRQIQAWLSVTGKSETFTTEERTAIEQTILLEIQAHTAYPLFHPKPEPWWKKFTAFF